MEPRDFCYWLQGWLEIQKPTTITPEQVQEIKNHLDLVFKKVTPNLGGSPRLPFPFPPPVNEPEPLRPMFPYPPSKTPWNPEDAPFRIDCGTLICSTTPEPTKYCSSVGNIEKVGDPLASASNISC